jgi:hypothetical protein
MTDTNGKYRGTVNYHLIYGELIRAAQYRGVTTYQAIAQIMGLPLKGSHMGKEVGQMLGEISEDEVSQGRPMLSAVAVGVNGFPGSGFYALARQFGRLTTDDKQAEEEFWKEELASAYKTWAREFRT